MKRKSLTVFLLLFLGLACWKATVSSMAIASDNKRLVLSADPWCPWNCDGVGENGIGVDLIKQFFEPRGYTVEYKPMPWTRAIAEATAGKVTGLVGADLLTPETKGFVFPREPIGKMNNVFVVPVASTFTYKGIESLRGKKIGIVADYHFGGEIGQYIDEHYKDPKVVEQVSGNYGAKQNLEKLIAGRIDLYVDEHFVIQFAGETTGLGSKIKQGGALNDAVPIYVAFSPADPRARELARIFDESMKAAVQDGSYAKILARYKLTPQP